MSVICPAYSYVPNNVLLRNIASSHFNSIALVTVTGYNYNLLNIKHSRPNCVATNQAVTRSNRVGRAIFSTMYQTVIAKALTVFSSQHNQYRSLSLRTSQLLTMRPFYVGCGEARTASKYIIGFDAVHSSPHPAFYT